MKYVNVINPRWNGYYDSTPFYAFIRKLGRNMYSVNHHLTTCTDYLTDLLMYPTKQVGVTVYDTVQESGCTRIIVVYKTETQCNNMIKYGLPVLHTIEKANHFKRTTVIKDGARLIVTGSTGWSANTFALSVYLKLFRIFNTINSVIKTYADLEPIFANHIKDSGAFQDSLVSKILFYGKIREVNRNCKYVHGHRTDCGEHSNNGVAYTICMYRMDINSQPEWGKKSMIAAKKSLKRLINLKRIEKELAERDLHALSFL